jgi:hypothetical protein
MEIMKIYSKAIDAFAAAFTGRKLDYHPREVVKAGEPNVVQIRPQDLSKRLGDRLAALSFKDAAEAKYHLDEVKASYAEVKAATEYQDQKTARLLTIMAFLTAAAGAIFTKVLDIYPLDFSDSTHFRNIIIFVIYSLFGFYLLLIAAGALISFYAMQTRFVFDEKSVVAAGKPQSLLFFKFISITSPEAWVEEYTASSSLQLLTTYVKHYVHETYLISIKTSDKVRRIQPAQDILQLAIKILILWILALILGTCFVPRATTQRPTDFKTDTQVSQATHCLSPAAAVSPPSEEKVSAHHGQLIQQTSAQATHSSTAALQTTLDQKSSTLNTRSSKEK